MAPEDEAAFVHTERTVLNALRSRHAPKERGGNGPEWAFVEHVRNAAGFNANRTIDAMALGLWPSRGMELHGYEVKVSRADFRREIADPAKMDAFAHVLDRFWIVAPKGVVPANELPATWGLLEVSDDGISIRQRVAAPLLTEDRAAIPRTLLVPLMRAAGAVVKSRPEYVEAEYKRGFAEGKEATIRAGKDWQRIYEEQTERLNDAREIVREIDSALGVNLTYGYGRQDRAETLARIAGAVKVAVNGDDAGDRAREAIRRSFAQLDFARGALDQAQKYIEANTGVKA